VGILGLQPHLGAFESMQQGNVLLPISRIRFGIDEEATAHDVQSQREQLQTNGDREEGRLHDTFRE
jgi:hypothetical protein